MGGKCQFALQNFRAAHVRFGSIASILACRGDVCFPPDSDHKADVPGCPLSANSGHGARVCAITATYLVVHLAHPTGLRFRACGRSFTNNPIIENHGPP